MICLLLELFHLLLIVSVVQVLEVHELLLEAKLTPEKQILLLGHLPEVLLAVCIERVILIY